MDGGIYSHRSSEVSNGIKDETAQTVNSKVIIIEVNDYLVDQLLPS